MDFFPPLLFQKIGRVFIDFYHPIRPTLAKAKWTLFFFFFFLKKGFFFQTRKQSLLKKYNPNKQPLCFQKKCVSSKTTLSVIVYQLYILPRNNTFLATYAHTKKFRVVKNSYLKFSKTKVAESYDGTNSLKRSKGKIKLLGLYRFKFSFS